MGSFGKDYNDQREIGPANSPTMNVIGAVGGCARTVRGFPGYFFAAGSLGMSTSTVASSASRAEGCTRAS
jgi:hypothetical protein